MTRVLGLDPGERTVGVAVSDELGLTAQPVGELRRRTPEADAAAVRRLVERYGAEVVVVGLPRRLDGTLGPEAEKARAWAAELERRLGLPVRLWDERLSTKEAERLLVAADVSRRRRRRRLHRVAAALILQSYLDGGREERVP